MTCRLRVAGPRRHRCSTWHRELVEGYRLAREVQLLRAEAATHGYATELAEYWRDVEPALTFREWLVGHRVDREAV